MSSLPQYQYDEVSNILDSYQDLPEESRKEVRDWLRSLGLGEAADKLEDDLPNQAMSPSFHCPIFDASLVTPCRLSSCRFYVDYSWSNNCMLSYMHNQKTHSLSLEEISFLYQIPIDDVRADYKSGLQKLRSEALFDESTSDDSLRRSFNFFPTKKICCVCESRIDGSVSQSLVIQSIGLAYCSRECKQEKPVRLVEIEHEYGLDIASVLEWSFTNFKNLGLAEQALGIPRWLAYYACKVFLGHELQDYFSSLRKARSKRKKLVRRTWHKPSLIESRIRRLEPTRRLVYRKYGPPSLGSSFLLDTLEWVLNER